MDRFAWQNDVSNQRSFCWMSKKHDEILKSGNFSCYLCTTQAQEHLRSQTQLFPILGCLLRKQSACICWEFVNQVKRYSFVQRYLYFNIHMLLCIIEKRNYLSEGKNVTAFLLSSKTQLSYSEALNWEKNHIHKIALHLHITVEIT